MLAAVNFNSGTGALVVVGNAIADTISLTGSADYQSFTVDINNNASLQQTFNYSDVTSVRVVAGDGDDFVYNTLLIDTEIFGQDGDDHLEGGWANDLVMGGNGIDVLVGRNGDDILNGQDGNDWLFGGPGVDALSGITGNDNLYGGVGDDALNGHGGNDSLWGGAGDDVLLGGADNDLLRGEDGDDTLRGEGGDDWLVGANGDDVLYGDAGVDELLGQAGNDILNGGADNDFLWGSAGEDTLRGDAGSDRLYGGADNDLLLGNEGRDIIRGDGGDDTLRGGDGDDDLYGLGGVDTIFGDAGDDLLDAGGDVAPDVLTGGSGLDRFVVLGNIGSSSVDVITDLEANETINGDAGGNTGGGNPPTPSGTASIGDLVFEDTDGDGVLDSGEGGIGDVMLTLFSGTTEIATQTTDASGQYKFENLAAGDYRVELTTDLSYDYDLTTPKFSDVTLLVGQVNNSVDFGAQALPPGTGAIGDQVFEDTNENGIFDSGDFGIADASVRLLRGATEVASVSTDNTGGYSFGQLRAGSYKVELVLSSVANPQLTTEGSFDVILLDGEHSLINDFGFEPPSIAIAREAFLLDLSQTQFLEQASILSTELVEETATFSIVDTGEAKLAFTRFESQGEMTFNLLGEFPSALSAEQIEQNFGQSSVFSAQTFFSDGIPSFHTVASDVLPGGFAEGTFVLLATNGDTALAIGEFPPAPQGQPASFSLLNAPVSVSRAAVQNAPFTNQNSTASFQARVDSPQEALRAAWIARIEAIEARHSPYIYWREIGGTLYVNEMITAILALNTRILIGQAPATTDARFIVNFAFGNYIETHGPIATVPDEIIIHESVHALNHFRGDSSESALDERIAYGVASLLAGETEPNSNRVGLTTLQNFEISLRAGFNPGLQAEYDFAWTEETNVPGGVDTNFRTLAGSMLITEWADINTATPFTKLTAENWAEIEIYSFDLSCSQLAPVYSATVPGLNLTCPVFTTLPSLA